LTACVDPGKTETLAVVFAVVDVVDVVEFVEEEEAEEALSLDHNVDSLIIVSPTVLASACEKKTAACNLRSISAVILALVGFGNPLTVEGDEEGNGEDVVDSVADNFSVVIVSFVRPVLSLAA
tara:strand:- start:90 stop:458 length:369 start_codon:yes stop_codon:yes gene_type:complete